MKFDKIKISFKNFFNFSRRDSYTNSSNCGNRSVTINNNQALESFNNSLKYFQAIGGQFLQRQSNINISQYHDAFNLAEKAYDNCKKYFPDDSDVKAFPTEAVSYYDVITPIEERAGKVVDQYRKKRNYYIEFVTPSQLSS